MEFKVGDHVKVTGQPIGLQDEPVDVVGVVTQVDHNDPAVDVFLRHGTQWWYTVDNVIPWADYC